MTRAELLAEMADRAARRGGRRGGIHAHFVAQADLRPEYPWPVKFGARDVATQAVVHLSNALKERADIVPVESDWFVYQGIKTSADAYTLRLQRRLTPEQRSRLASEGASTGDPIMELPAGVEQEEPWRSYPDFLASSPEPTAILYGALDQLDYKNLVWIGRDDKAPKAVIQSLERLRPVLATRYDMAGIPTERWYETARPRDRQRMGSARR
jgi:hypothetical protein